RVCRFQGMTDRSSRCTASLCRQPDQLKRAILGDCWDPGPWSTKYWTWTGLSGRDWLSRNGWCQQLKMASRGIIWYWSLWCNQHGGPATGSRRCWLNLGRWIDQPQLAINLFPKNYHRMGSLWAHGYEFTWGFYRILSFVCQSLDPSDTSGFIRGEQGG